MRKIHAVIIIKMTCVYVASVKGQCDMSVGYSAVNYPKMVHGTLRMILPDGKTSYCLMIPSSR